MVGISNYVRFNNLPNAANDALAIANLLKKAGAQVILAQDCNILQLREKKKQFLSLLNEGDIAIFFFEGHGCQFRNQQLLIARPFNRMEITELEVKPKLIAEYSIQIDLLLDDLREKKTHFNLILLDCCRSFHYVDICRGGDDPIKDGDQQRFNLNVPKGTVIGHASAPGDKAYDGSKSDGTKGSGYTKDPKSKGHPSNNCASRALQIFIQNGPIHPTRPFVSWSADANLLLC